jgi:AcrR family transcriptional regulator
MGPPSQLDIVIDFNNVHNRSARMPYSGWQPAVPSPEVGRPLHDDTGRPAHARRDNTEMTKSSQAPQGTKSKERITRGGWVASGTAAQRRAIHSERGTPRGDKTRRRILEAARTVFERDGYFDVGINDIVKEAGVARGSFYTYFTSKLEVFMVLTNEVAALVEQSIRRQATERDLDPVEVLCRANARYIETYRRHAHIYALGTQLSHIDQQLHRNYLSHRHRHLSRTEQAIRRWQALGLADPTLDSLSTATALVSMSSALCYGLFVVKDEGYDVDVALTTMNEIWIRALDLQPGRQRVGVGSPPADNQQLDGSG